MKPARKQRGFLLIVAVVLIAVAAVMAVVIVTLTAGSGQSGGLHVSSTQALFAAESGIEQATRLFKNGTSCANLAATIGTPTVGNASYSVSASAQNLNTTILAGGVTAGATTIPTNTADLSVAGYATHGRIVVDGEQIVYTGLSGNSFTGALRGFAGTAAVAHLVNAPVIQNQCLVRATGTSETGTPWQATRVVESAVQNGPWSDFLDDTSTAVPSAAVGSLHTLNGGSGLVTSLPAGNNLIVAMVTLRNNAVAAFQTIAVGNLRLVKVGTGTLASNQYAIDVGGSQGGPANQTFPQKAHFFVHRDVGAAANSTYRIDGQASGNNIQAEVKMLVINSPPNSNSQASSSVPCPPNPCISTVQTTVLTHNSGVPAGDNIIIAAVQWDNTNAGAIRSITAGNLRLNRTGLGVLASNQFDITMSRSARVNANGGMLLIGRDTGAPANPTYTVSAQASNNNSAQMEAKLIVISGVAGLRVDGGGTPLTAAPTSLGSLITAFPKLSPGGSNLVIATTQYDNAAAATRNIAAGGEDIVFSAADQSSNEYQIDLCTTGTAECDDFAAGLMWRQTDNPNASPTFSVATTPSSTVAPTISGEANILGIHLNPIADRLEIFP